MGSLENDRRIIKEIILDYTKVPYAHGDIQFEPVFDEHKDRYLLMIQGWDKEGRVHGCLIHVDIVDGKFWIQRDGTERGIALELGDAGVPKERIVLGFYTPRTRSYGEYAVA